jgi:hypothetical protein
LDVDVDYPAICLNGGDLLLWKLLPRNSQHLAIIPKATTFLKHKKSNEIKQSKSLSSLIVNTNKY